MSEARRGSVFIISGPSGVGKHTILEGLVEAGGTPGDPLLTHSISATSRAPRPGEVDGRDYFFLDAETQAGSQGHIRLRDFN